MKACIAERGSMKSVAALMDPIHTVHATLHVVHINKRKQRLTRKERTHTRRSNGVVGLYIFQNNFSSDK